MIPTTRIAVPARALIATLALAWANVAMSQTASYDGSTRYLTLPSVTTGGTTYSNVVIRLDSFSIISVGGSGGSVAATCSPGMLTLAKFNAVAAGMTLAQVNQLMGCQYYAPQVVRTTLFTEYVWVTTDAAAFIEVTFDPSGSFVQDIGGGFKFSSGL